MRKPIFLFVVFCLAFAIYFSWVGNALADFGVFPSTISNPRLLPGSHFEQTIKLSRSEFKQDLKLEITIEPSEIENWIKIYPVRDEFFNGIDQVNSFTIPKGEKESWFKVLVDIPEDADFGDYPGAILIRGVSLTANINLDFKITQEDIVELKVFSPHITDLKQGENIKVLLDIENKGNVEGGPSRAHLDIYNLLGGNILESVDVVKLSSIKPFESKEIVVEFPTNLAVGQYRADFTIFKGREILREQELTFGVAKKEAPPQNSSQTRIQKVVQELEVLQKFPRFFDSHSQYFYLTAGIVLVAGMIFLSRTNWGKDRKKIRDIKPTRKSKIVKLKQKRK